MYHIVLDATIEPKDKSGTSYYYSSVCEISNIKNITYAISDMIEHVETSGKLQDAKISIHIMKGVIENE